MLYSIGETVICGTEGPCTITAIGDPGLGKRTKGKTYYTLRPVYRPDATLYVPEEREEERMRPVLSKEEALACVERLRDTKEVSVTSERTREQEYREVMYRGGCLNCDDLARISKTIYGRKQERDRTGKRLTELDQRYYQMAQEKLLQELSVSLEMTVEETDRYIRERMVAEDR